MGSNGDEVMSSGSDVAGSSETTVEIKIKTLDSQTYTLRVNKYVPVPALKEQIATVTGVLSERQRLICRGKVLKDDQLLSAYHVEDGHTLHMVVGQPVPPSSESLTDHPATDPASSAGRSHSSVVVGTFNVSDPGDSGLQDISRILSAVFSTIGANIGNGGEGVDPREPSIEVLSRTLTFGGSRDSGSRQQTDQAATGAQPSNINISSLLPNQVPLDPLQTTVISDSLATLSQYLIHMRRLFGANVIGQSQSNNAQSGGSHVQEADALQGGLPTPAALAEVLQSTRQLFDGQAGECISQLASQLADQENITEHAERMVIQSRAMRIGALLQHLGAMLLELGRATVTTRMGRTPVDAVVNAGPAIFISPEGPAPIMVQALQPAPSFGRISTGILQSGSASSRGPFASGFLPRNIDIRIQSGSLTPAATGNQREQANAPQPPAQTAQTASGGASIARPLVTRALGSPIVSGPLQPPISVSHSSVATFYPVIARVQRVGPGSATSVRSSQSTSSDFEQSLESAMQNHIIYPGSHVESQSGAAGQHTSTETSGSSISELLRTIFPSDNTQDMETAANTREAPMSASNLLAAAIFSDRLRQIMPVISQITADGTNIDPEAAPGSSTQAEANSDVGTSSSRQDDPPTPPNAKRQKKE